MPTVEVPTGALVLTGYEPIYAEDAHYEVPIRDSGFVPVGSDDFNRTATLGDADGWIVPGTAQSTQTASGGRTPIRAITGTRAAWFAEDFADAVEGTFSVVTSETGVNLSIRAGQLVPGKDSSDIGYNVMIGGSSDNLIQLRKGNRRNPVVISKPWSNLVNTTSIRLEAVDEGADVRIRAYQNGVLRLDYLDTDNPVPRGGYAGWAHDDYFVPVSATAWITNFEIFQFRDSGLSLRGFAPTVDQGGAVVEVPTALAGSRGFRYRDRFGRSSENLEASANWTRVQGATSWTVADGIMTIPAVNNIYYEFDISEPISGFGFRFESFNNLAFFYHKDPATINIGANEEYRVEIVQGSPGNFGYPRVTKHNAPIYTPTDNRINQGEYGEVIITKEWDAAHLHLDVRFDFYADGFLVGTYTDLDGIDFNDDVVYLKSVALVVELSEIAVYTKPQGLLGLVPHFAGEYTTTVPTGALTLTGLVPEARDSDKLIKPPVAGEIAGSSSTSDSFTRSDEALDANSAWEEITAGVGLRVVTNAISHTVDSSTLSAYAITEATHKYHKNQAAEVTLTSVGLEATNVDGYGLAIRAASGQQITAYVNFFGFNVQIDDGTYSELISVTRILDSDTIRLEAVGDQVSFSVNGSVIHTFTTTVLGGGQPGVVAKWASGTAPIMDDFAAYDYVPGIALIGLVPSITINVFPVPTGTLTLTGLVPTVEIAATDITVEVPVGAMVLTGRVPTVFVPVLIVPPVGAMTLTGLAPLISPLVPLGAMSLTGLVPTIISTAGVIVPVGSLALTGLVPDVLNPAGTAVPVGAMILTGLAPSVTNPAGAEVPVGAITLAGQVPSVISTAGVIVPIGSMTLTGLVPDVLNPAGAAVPVGSLSLVGLAPNVEQAVVENVPTGTLVFTGLVPGVLNPAGAEVPVGSLSLVGIAPLIEPLVPVGTLTLTGLEPVVLLGDNQTVLVPLGSMTLAGLAPTLGLDVAIPLGAVTFTGLAAQPKLSTDENMSWVTEPELGAITFVGLAPTIRDDYNVPAGAMTLSGLAPTILNPQGMIVPTGALTLTGLTPTVLTPRLVDVPVGSLTFTGIVPTTISTAGVIVPVGSLSFAGLAPDVLNPAGAEVPIGSLTLAGLAPNVLNPAGAEVPTGALTFTGLVPDALTPRVADVPAGSLSFAGLVPTVLNPQGMIIPAGAMTLTGLEPVVVVGDAQTILVPLGSLTLTGLAPTVLTPRLVDVPVGSILFTGLVPTTLTPRLVDVPTGSLSFTGLVPTVLVPGAVNVPTGALTLAGLVPTIINPAGAVVPTGTLALTGLVPEILNSVTVPVPAGALTLTGLTPTVEQDVLENVPTGALTLTGLQPIAINPQGMVVPTGTLTLTGLVPSAPVSIVVPVPAGSLSLTGLTPTVEQDVVEDIPTGSLAITGLVPVIDLTDLIVVDVPVGSLSIAGLQPTALTPRTVDVPVGSLSMVGFAPTIDISAAPLIIPTGALTLAGFAPEVFISADVVVEVPTGALILTGYSPILFGQIFEIPTGSLLLTGLAPRIQFARDYSVHVTYKRYYSAWTDGGEGRVFRVGSDEGTDIQ